MHHSEKHLIIYMTNDCSILIFRVLHQCQDVPALISN